MAASSHRVGAGGQFYGGAGAYRSREGLSTRPVAGSDEIQLRIDPMHADLDDEITGLHSQVKLLRNQMSLIKAQAGVKNNMRRLNLSIVKHGSSHIVHVVLFALLLFSILYLWSKMLRR